MQPRLRSVALALFCVSAAGCGDQADSNSSAPAGGGVYAEMLANAATEECLEKASAPGAGDQAQLQSICDCTHDKIVAAQPGPFEEEASRRKKLKDALDSCVEEAGTGVTG